MNETVHIVCLDAPAPPNYGGAIDMFYKIKALHEIGTNIILHYFNYNNARQTSGLEKYCAEIHAYQRRSLMRALPISRPFIVRSRVNQKLIYRLNADNFPVILEGLHCAGIIPFLQNKKRVVLRMHNDEARYYRSLAQSEKSFLKSAYFLHESNLLHNYQMRLDKDIKLACLSESDVFTLRNNYHFNTLHFIPCFLPWQEIKSRTGFGEYCLYHGNLAVAENVEAVFWLVQNVFGKLNVPLVVAGNGASMRLTSLTNKKAHIFLVNNPPADELGALISDAHVHVLPSVNRTGVKLKLLNALLNGRYCITNKNGVSGSGVEKGLLVKNSPREWIESIEQLVQKPFSDSEIQERESILTIYDNHVNAQKLSALWTRYQ